MLLFYVSGENVAIVHKPSYINIVNQGGSIPLTDLQHILLSIHGFTLHKVGGLLKSIKCASIHHKP